MIGRTPFAKLATNAKVELFEATLTNFEKALGERDYPDPATLLPPGFRDFLDVFSREEVDHHIDRAITK